MKHIESFLYDLFGWFVLVVIILFSFFCCSSNVRELVYSIMDKNETQTTTNVSKPKRKTTAPKSTTKAPAVNNDGYTDTIPLTKGSGKLFYVQTKIHGIPMKFALDTGCSDMSMSIVEYLFLEHQGVINESSNRTCESSFANGETEQSFTTQLDSVTIGKKTISNVTCSISKSQNAPLLLGQSVLDKLGEITIQHSKQLLLVN